MLSRYLLRFLPSVTFRVFRGEYSGLEAATGPRFNQFVFVTLVRATDAYVYASHALASVATGCV